MEGSLATQAAWTCSALLGTALHFNLCKAGPLWGFARRDSGGQKTRPKEAAGGHRGDQRKREHLVQGQLQRKK